MERGFGEDDNFWTKIGQEVVKAAVNTLVEEGIEAVVEIWKKRRLKIQKDELERRKESNQEAAEAPSPANASRRKSYPGEGSDPEESDEAEAACFGGESPASGARRGVEPFAHYVAAHGDE